MKAKGSNSAAQPIDSALDRSAQNSKHEFLVAAIGASAGGIEAFTELVRNLPGDTGMCLVLIQHLDPKHHSILTELVAKETPMPVAEVTDGMKLQPDRIYVIPPNTTMSVSDHALHLTPRDGLRSAHMPIDHFMRSLAEAQGNRAIGVILSGFGTDGTLGMAEIQAQGGVTFAQDDRTAKYDAMPRAAIAAGCVDYILPPKGIAGELSRIAQHPYVRRPAPDSEPVSDENFNLSSIFQLLRRSTGVDFTHYRQTTILRRIQRRMVVHKIDKLDDYVKYIQTNPPETKLLYQDMLINVTSFFRNPNVFDTMKARIFPAIMKNRTSDAPIRIWTPGCASGEETYSVAITLLEFLGDTAPQTAVQLFGTDVSDVSIAKARTGAYPENIQEDVSSERLRRYFTRTEGSYRISKNIRDMCIFAQHNVLNDPPFSQMDLICCRNLLIYLEPVLQAKVISLFHYAARPSGFLILGTSEGVGTVGNLFSMEDRAHKIFSKKASTSRQLVTFSLTRHPERPEFGGPRAPSRAPDSAWNYLEGQKEFDRRLLAQYSPAAVLINEDMEIIHTRGNVSHYLKLSPGRASLSVLKMAREGLLFDLRNAINRARKENTPVHKQNIQIKNGNGSAGAGDTARLVNLEVIPVRIGNAKESFFMVLFHDAPTAVAPKSRAAKSASRVRDARREASRITKLEEELAATKEYLQSVIETQEATNEELQSANEEILSSNEELQSTNEELETAKEELQSTNEELTTVNDELRSRNLEITNANNDLNNLFASLDMALIIIGGDLTVRRITPEAEKLMGLIPADVGRPFVNINPTIQIPDLQQAVLRAVSTFQRSEREVAHGNGQRYILRIVPYRTPEGKNDGVVLMLLGLASK